jgi:hypothetical protein
MTKEKNPKFFGIEFIALIALAVVLSGCTTNPLPGPEPLACTMDAKICPDGSAVGRDPNNNCEFFECPNPSSENGVHVKTLKEVYAAEEAVKIEVENNSGKPIYIYQHGSCGATGLTLFKKNENEVFENEVFDDSFFKETIDCEVSLVKLVTLKLEPKEKKVFEVYLDTGTYKVSLKYSENAKLTQDGQEYGGLEEPFLSIESNEFEIVGENYGFVQGKVTIGPLCPVETNPPQSECMPTPAIFQAYPITVYDVQTQKLVKTFNANADGTYEISLPEGGYELKSETGLQSFSDKIVIEADQIQTLDISIDTGIR